jgi:hypothetical protein
MRIRLTNPPAGADERQQQCQRQRYLIRLHGYLDPDDLPLLEGLKITVVRQDRDRSSGAD